MSLLQRSRITLKLPVITAYAYARALSLVGGDLLQLLVRNRLAPRPVQHALKSRRLRDQVRRLAAHLTITSPC